MGKSLALRLAVAFGAVGVAAAMLTAVLVNLAFERRFDSYVTDRSRGAQQELRLALGELYQRSGGWEDASLDALGTAALMNGLALTIEDASGEAVWSLDQVSGGMAAMHRRMMGPQPLGPERRLPIEVEGQTVGFAVVRFPEGSLSPEDVSLRASVNRLLVSGGLVAGLAALGAGLLLARRTTAPVAELTAAARQLAGGDRARRVRADRSDELGEMGRAFNQMADTIEDEDRLRRTFAGDVAHELRTPLTILRSQVEALQDAVATPTPAALASLSDEILRLSRLVADLEALASADASGFSLDRQRVRVATLLQETARSFSGVLSEKGLRLELDLDEGIEVEADPTRLRQVVSNLMSNAVKFTPSGGLVRLQLERDGASALIQVVDTGPGIPAEELPSVFERFFRGRQVRSGGSGIGLAIVHQLVTAHGGKVEVASEPGNGATFSVRLPQRAPASAVTGPA